MSRSSRPTPHRRRFLAAAGAAWFASSRTTFPLFAADPAPPEGSIASVTPEAVIPEGKGNPTWFHPRACMVPGETGPKAFMTLQTILGSDFFGPVHWMESADLGRTWSTPQPVPPLGRVPTGDDRGEEGVCDVVPEYHAATKSILAVGHNVFYKGPRFSADQPPRRPVYAVFKDGKWGERKHLLWDDPRGAAIYTNGCGQRINLPTGDLLLALSFGVKGKPRAVAGALCSFDGETLAIKTVGEPLVHERGRGLLEPSLAVHGEKYYITLRAEDGRGYVSTSKDGLSWAPKKLWTFDDGAPLETSTTQQHWLTHPSGLHLVYTRKDASNVNVFRWRAPLYLAEVNPETLQLIRSSERIVFPLEGDGVAAPEGVPLTDNFHVNPVSADESWITVGSWRPKRNLSGRLLLARVKWNKP